MINGNYLMSILRVIPLVGILILICSVVKGQERDVENFSESELNSLVYFAPEELSKQNQKLLNQMVSIDLNQIPLENALRKISDIADLRLVFSKDVALLNWDQVVTMKIEQATVLGALYAILYQADRDNMKLSMSNYGQIIISKNDIPSVEEDVSSGKLSIAQNIDGEGTIIGEVRDQGTGESLPGANVIVQGTTIGTATDVDGRFTLRRIPAGEIILEIRFLGYVTNEVEVFLENDERLEVNTQLESDFIDGDEVLVIGLQRGISRALTQQRNSINIQNVISSEQIDAFADQDVSSALSRVVGMGHGGTNIRGVGIGASNITMDGQRMGSTDGDRSVDLSTISADMVQELHVIKVITPDMDADALSGVINVNTRRPIGGEQFMNIRLGGGMQNRYFPYAGAAARTSFSYGDSPSDYLSYSINLSYQRSPSSSERISMSWGERTFEDYGGRVDVLNDVENRVQFDVRERYGGGFQMTFQPTDRSTYHIQSMFNLQERKTTQYGVRYDISTSTYINPYETQDGKPLSYRTQLTEPRTQQYTTQVSGRYLMDLINVEYAIGWGYGRKYEESYNPSARTPGDYQFLTNIGNRSNPIIEITNQRFPLIEDVRVDNFSYEIDHHKDNELTSGLNFEIPYNRGSIKFGSSAILSFREGWSERFSGMLDLNRAMPLTYFEHLPNSEWRVFDEDHLTYRIPVMIDLDKLKNLYHAQRPHFEMRQDLWNEEIETSLFSHGEHTLATYIMGDVKWHRFTLLGGIRMEHWINKYAGREGEFSSTGTYRGSDEITSTVKHTNYFPNLQLVYSLGRMTNIRGAYSTSIGRPSMGQLRPNVMINYENMTIRQGNPRLKPMVTHNLDFIVDHYFMNIGQLSLGLYLKNMSKFIYSHTERISTDSNQDIDNIGTLIWWDDSPDLELYSGWELRTLLNGQDAKTYGLELSWQQYLDFLPGFLGNFGTYANYGYTQSFADIGRRHPDPAINDTIMVPLSRQRPHVVNAGISYSQGRFNTQISYQWSTPSISSYGSQTWVPQIHQRHREYFDAYSDGASNLSLTARFRFSPAFRIWVDASNILNYKSLNYRYNRDYYPQSISLSGRTVNIGLRYTF